MIGIHGNYECIRCGACCVYFHILAEKPEHGPNFKPVGEKCRYLSLDSEGVASCSVHEGDRHEACKNFICSLTNITMETCAGLMVTAEDLARQARMDARKSNLVQAS